MEDRFCCSIEQQLLMDPVRIKGEPNVYEADTIYKLYRNSPLSPFTRVPFVLKDIERDFTLRNEIQKMVACAKPPVDIEIIEARKMNTSDLENQFLKFLSSERYVPIEKNICYVHFLLEDAVSKIDSTDPVRAYSTDYITALKNDFKALDLKRKETGYFHLVRNKAVRFSCCSFILSCERLRFADIYKKQLLFHDSRWTLVIFKYENHVNNKTNTLEYITRVNWTSRLRNTVILLYKGVEHRMDVVYEPFDPSIKYFIKETLLC